LFAGLFDGALFEVFVKVFVEVLDEVFSWLPAEVFVELSWLFAGVLVSGCAWAAEAIMHAASPASPPALTIIFSVGETVLWQLKRIILLFPGAMVKFLASKLPAPGTVMLT
jgi:hypothetical protein